ncbi:MAG TPA: rod shape-determining protein MreC [Solirubrobacteraceae bacterium]|jgi:rod shape-determining protein MreC|nr:rod shape-determining protein MreC [Solirubrobacteraceae bacterium]
MYDKTVRRRRAVLGVLVALSLILLTAYFGEAPGGGLHSVQRGFLTVIAPIQDGANKALKPVRDLFGWVGDTLHAKSQRDDLLRQNERLRAQLIAKQFDERSYRELLALYHLDERIGARGYSPVTATVIASSPIIWYATITINAGTSRGVRVNDPVINGEGLIGKVTLAASDGAQVSLITDSAVGVTAMVSASGATGILQPKVGDPSDLLLQYLPAGASVSPGDYVVTAGSVAGKSESLYPPGIPIGQVSSVEEESPYKPVNVRPLANLHNLDVVQVLTNIHGGGHVSTGGAG